MVFVRQEALAGAVSGTADSCHHLVKLDGCTYVAHQPEPLHSWSFLLHHVRLRQFLEAQLLHQLVHVGLEQRLGLLRWGGQKCQHQEDGHLPLHPSLFIEANIPNKQMIISVCSHMAVCMCVGVFDLVFQLSLFLYSFLQIQSHPLCLLL